MSIICKKLVRGKPCGKECSSLKGLKHHMTASHGEYTSQDIDDAVAGTSDIDADVSQRMNAFADSIPADEVPPASGATDTSTSGATPVEKPGEQPKKPEDTKRRVRATPKKMKNMFASLPKKFLESQGITLDEEDRETLDEVGEFLSDCFGVEFAVPQSKLTVNSRLWAFAWVLGIVALIFVKHKFSVLMALIMKKGEQEPEGPTIDVEPVSETLGDA